MGVTNLFYLSLLVVVVVCQDSCNNPEITPESGQVCEGKCRGRTFGKVADLEQCDLFWKCARSGLGEANYCPEGLLFDPKGMSCKKAQEVDCGDRVYVQETPSNVHVRCVKTNGIFDFVDLNGQEANVCDKYIECSENVPYERPCSVGTLFDVTLGDCVRPEERGEGARICETSDQVDESLIIDGFSCPSLAPVFNGLQSQHPIYRHPRNCHEYFVCYDNKKPNKFGCQDPKVFDTTRNQCVDPLENFVCECSDPTTGEPVQCDYDY